MQGDVEDVSAAAAEPGGQSAQLVVMFGQQHGVARAGQRVGGGHAAQPAADNDDVVLVAEVLRKVAGHRRLGAGARELLVEGVAFALIALPAFRLQIVSNGLPTLGPRNNVINLQLGSWRLEGASPAGLTAETIPQQHREAQPF